MTSKCGCKIKLNIKVVNQQKDIDGILVQLPLPIHISEDKVILSDKDMKLK